MMMPIVDPALRDALDVAFNRGFAAGQLGRLSLEAEIARLREEGIAEYHALTETIAQTFPVHDGEDAEVALYQRAVREAGQKIDALTEALAFYADPQSYIHPKVGGETFWAPIYQDGHGQRARAALAVDEDVAE